MKTMIMKNTFSVVLLLFLLTAPFCSAPIPPLDSFTETDRALLFASDGRTQLFEEKSLPGLVALRDSSQTTGKLSMHGSEDQFENFLRTIKLKSSLTTSDKKLLPRGMVAALSDTQWFTKLENLGTTRRHLQTVVPSRAPTRRNTAVVPSAEPRTPPQTMRRVETLASSRTGSVPASERPEWSSRIQVTAPIARSLRQPPRERYPGEAEALLTTPSDRLTGISDPRRRELLGSSPLSFDASFEAAYPSPRTPSPSRDGRDDELSRRESQLEDSRAGLATAAELIASENTVLDQRAADLRRQQNALQKETQAARNLAGEAQKQIEAAARAQQEVTTERERLRLQGQTQSEKLTALQRASEELKRRAQDAQRAQQDAAQKASALEGALAQQGAELMAARQDLAAKENALRSKEQRLQQMEQQLADSARTLQAAQSNAEEARAARARSEKELARLEQTLAQQQQTAERNLSDTQRQTRELEADLVTARQRGEELDGLQQQLQTAREAQAAQQARVAELEREVAAKRQLEAQLQTAQRSVAELVAAAADAQERGQGLSAGQEDELTRARAATAHAESQITSLRQTAEAATARISQAETRAQDALRAAAAETEQERARAVAAERQLEKSLTESQRLQARITALEAAQAAATTPGRTAPADDGGLAAEITALREQLRTTTDEMRSLAAQEEARRAVSRRTPTSSDRSDSDSSGTESDDAEDSATGLTGRRGRRSAAGRRAASSGPAASATGGDGSVWAAAAKFLKTQTTFLGEQMTGERTSRDTAVTTAAYVEKTRIAAGTESAKIAAKTDKARIDAERKRANRVQNTEEFSMSQQGKTRAAELRLEATRIKSASEVELARIKAESERRAAKSEKVAQLRADAQESRRAALAQATAATTALMEGFAKVFEAARPQQTQPQPASAAPAPAPQEPQQQQPSTIPLSANSAADSTSGEPASRRSAADSDDSDAASQSSTIPSPAPRRNLSFGATASTPGRAATDSRLTFYAPQGAPRRRAGPKISAAEAQAMKKRAEADLLRQKTRLAQARTKQAEAEARRATAQAAAGGSSTVPPPPPSPSASPGSSASSSFFAGLGAARGGSPGGDAGSTLGAKAQSRNPFFRNLQRNRAQDKNPRAPK